MARRRFERAKVWVSTAGLLAFVSHAHAQTPAETEKAIENQPGAQITRNVRPDGTETKTIQLPSGVSFLVSHAKDGSVGVTGIDNSGHGAVMCVWSVYVQLSVALDICDSTPDPVAKAALSDAIGQMDEFIIKNSLTPVSQAELDARKASERSKGLTAISGLSKEDASRRCASGNISRMLAAIGTTTAGKLKAEIANLLAVPRPPVMNPCL